MAANSARLNVNLQAIVANWKQLKALHGGGDTAAVVKADAYGLGAVAVTKALMQAGCSRFFVATLAEAIALREAIADANIYVFQGVLKGEERDYAHHRIHPVINHVGGLQQWLNFSQTNADAPIAALHIDSGMNRLGLNIQQLENPDILAQARALNADLLMTHYACASDLASHKNIEQFAVMQKAEALLPHLITCYGNSAAHFLPMEFHGKVTRPGCAIYGINPLDCGDDMMQPVCEIHAPILQLSELQHNQTVGYGATESLRAGAKILTVGIGYADGIHRQASHKLYGFIGDNRLPLVGRVTMDMLCFDATNVPSQLLHAANEITIMDSQRQNVNHMAKIYNTIGYEVLTSIGNRITRIYN